MTALSAARRDGFPVTLFGRPQPLCLCMHEGVAIGVPIEEPNSGAALNIAPPSRVPPTNRKRPIYPHDNWSARAASLGREAPGRATMPQSSPRGT